MKNYFKYLILSISITLISYLICNHFISSSISWIISICLSIPLSIYILHKNVEHYSFNKLFITTSFLLILFVPFVGPKETETMENRTLAEFPEWRWSNVWDFFSGYHGYFDDRFAFRNTVIDIYGNLRSEKLGLKPISNNVTIGNDGWLFMSNSDYLKEVSNPFSPQELQQFHYNLVVVTKWFEQHGIKYYLTLPPVKPHIYPEKLPDYMRIKMSTSKLEQISTYLNQKSDLNIIDYRKEIIERKKNLEVYYKTDTHWNRHGAYIGYYKIISTIANDFPQIIPHELDEFEERKISNYQGGDLLAMLGYKSSFSNDRYNLIHKDTIRPKLIFATNLQKPSNGYEIWKMPKKKNGLKLFMMRDSFTQYLKSYLTPHFDKSVYAWMPQIPIAKINEEKPDIVLHELLDRFVDFYMELPPEIKNDTTFLKQFNIDDY
jgi:SGNH hydrolase-like domain, acetyltransferase AlgX